MKEKKKSEDNVVKYGTISLPLPLVELVKKKIKGTGMPSVSAYVAYVLRQVLAEETLNEDTERDVKRRLKALGYI